MLCHVGRGNALLYGSNPKNDNLIWTYEGDGNGGGDLVTRF